MLHHEIGYGRLGKVVNLAQLINADISAQPTAVAHYARAKPLPMPGTRFSCDVSAVFSTICSPGFIFTGYLVVSRMARSAVLPPYTSDAGR